MKEKIVIGGYLYNCPKGTTAKLRELLDKGNKAESLRHEYGTAYDEYHKVLDDIKATIKGTYLDAIFNRY